MPVAARQILKVLDGPEPAASPETIARKAGMSLGAVLGTLAELVDTGEVLVWESRTGPMATLTASGSARAAQVRERREAARAHGSRIVYDTAIVEAAADRAAGWIYLMPEVDSGLKLILRGSSIQWSGPAWLDQRPCAACGGCLLPRGHYCICCDGLFMPARAPRIAPDPPRPRPARLGWQGRGRSKRSRSRSRVDST
jgi:hypothetical protein